LFPVVLTPYGIAAIIALLEASQATERTVTILGILVLVMFLNLLAMWFVRRILVGFVLIGLQVLGAVLAVLQVTLSVQFMIVGLRALRAFSWPFVPGRRRCGQFQVQAFTPRATAALARCRHLFCRAGNEYY
jgi:hypothetical protein